MALDRFGHCVHAVNVIPLDIALERFLFVVVLVNLPGNRVCILERILEWRTDRGVAISVGWIILVVSCLAGILANSIGSSYLGQVAAIGALSAFLFVAGGSLHFVRVLVLVGLLGLLVIPEGLWQPLAKFTNDRFVDSTADALDYLAIPNVRTDWKIEFPKVAVDVGVLGWATESLFT